MITLHLAEIWEHSDIADSTQNTSSQAISLSRLSRPLYLKAVLENTALKLQVVKLQAAPHWMLHWQRKYSALLLK